MWRRSKEHLPGPPPTTTIQCYLPPFKRPSVSFLPPLGLTAPHCLSTHIITNLRTEADSKIDTVIAIFHIPIILSYKDHPMIENLSGIIVWTDNLERLKKFYEQVLGLTPHSVRENFIAYKWNAGKAEIRFSIGLHSRVNGRSKDPFRAMINFDVTDINEISSRLKAHGTKFIREPELEHWGGLVATFEDPDGNIIQMLQQPISRKAS